MAELRPIAPDDRLEQVREAVRRGWRLTLIDPNDHGSPRRDDGYIALPREEGQLPGWLAKHPDACTYVHTGIASNIVELTAMGDRAVERVERAMPAGCEPVVWAEGQLATVYAFAPPREHVVLGGVRYGRRPDGPVLILEGEGCRIGLEADLAGNLRLPERRDLPPLPGSLAEMFTGAPAPRDGRPRFREMGTTRGRVPWWTTDAYLLARPQLHAGLLDDSVQTVSCYVVPDPESAHVCDFLCESDHPGSDALERSLDDARKVVWELTLHGVPLSAIELWYTGGKSIHVLVRWFRFGQIPRLDGHDVMAEIARRLLGGVVEYDPSLFHRRQKRRVPGTRHGGSGRYCIPVPVDDVWTITAAELRLRAAAPVWTMPANDGQPVDTLVELWKEVSNSSESGRTQASVRSPRRRARQVGEQTTPVGRGASRAAERRAARRALRKLGGHPACIEALRAGTPTLPKHRNDTTVALASYAATGALGELARRRLFREVSPQLTSSTLDAAGREAALNETFGHATGTRGGHYVFGGQSCGALRNAGLPCDRLCPVRRVWGRATPRPGARRPEPLPPGVAVTPPPRPPEGLSRTELLGTLRAGIAATVGAAVRERRTIGVAGPPGVGKTSIVQRSVQEMIASSPKPMRVLWASPRHCLLDDLEQGWSGLVHVPKREEACLRNGELGPLLAAGWGGPVSTEFCLGCVHHPRHAARGGGTCAYRAALSNRQASWAVAHELASMTDYSTRFHLTVIDEDFLKSCLRERAFWPADLERAAELVGTDGASVERLRRATGALAKLQLGAKRLVRGGLRPALAGLDAAQFCADVDGIDWQTIRPILPTGFEDYGLDSDEPRPAARVPPPNPRPLLDAVRDILGNRAASVCWTGTRWTVSWIERPRLGDGPVLVLDATMQPEMIEHLLGRPVEIRRFDLPFDAPVLQIVDGGYSRSSLFDDHGRGAVRRRTVDRLLRVVAARAVMCAGRTLLITFMKLAKGYFKTDNAKTGLPENVDVMWYGNLRGKDLPDYRQIILLGFPYASPDAVLSLAAALHQGEEPIDEQTVEQVVPYVAVNDWTHPEDDPAGFGGPVGLRVRHFVDPRAEAVRRLLEDAEFYQTIHRIRQINDPTKVTILLTNVPVDPEYGVPVRLVELDDLLPRPAALANAPRTGEAYAACSDFLDQHGFVSVPDVCKDYPELSPRTVARAVRQLADDVELPRLTIAQVSGPGGNRLAYGDPDACQRHHPDVQITTTAGPGQPVGQGAPAATTGNQTESESLPRSVEDPSYTCLGKDSPNESESRRARRTRR